MSPRDQELRALVQADSFLVRAATLLNLNWKGERFDYAQMDAEPHLSRYHRVDLAGATMESLRRRRSLTEISLSVEEGNPALRLYETALERTET